MENNTPELTTTQKVEKAKDILADIFNLYQYDKGNRPAGYGNWELDKATDAMQKYIKTITDNG